MATEIGISWSSSTKFYRNGRIKEVSEFCILDTMARRKFIEDQNTTKELSGRVQELQNEVNCMSDSKDFQDAESVRSGNSHVTSRPVSFPLHPILEGMLRHSFVSLSRNNGPPSIWDTWFFGKRFCSSTCIFISTLSSRIESMEFIDRRAAPFVHCGEKWKARTKSGSEMPVWTVSKRFAKDSVILSGGDSSKNFGADQQRLQISDLHFDKFPTPATFACWKIRFKTEVCTCSQFPTQAMQWIKEVEMVDSVDDLKSSSSTRGIQMPNFEVLDARIASALNQVIHNTQFKKKGQSGRTKGPEAGPFPSWQTDWLLDLRLLPGHWSKRFCRKLCRPIHSCSTKWWHSGIRRKVGRNSIVYDEDPRLMTSWKDCTN